MKRIPLHICTMIAFACLISTSALRSQCLQSVTFYDWSPTGDSTGPGSCNGGEWALLNSGTEVYSLCNTDYPKMYVGPDTLINVRITGTFRAEDSDNDYLGFVFGFKETWDYAWSVNNPYMNHEYYLFDWKQGNQTVSGFAAQAGYTLAKVNGNCQRTIPATYGSFWAHNSSANFTVLQSIYGTTQGWAQNTNYNFELLYTPTRAVIIVNNDTIFDQPGCYEPGLFGFYNLSQRYNRYWNFNYELYVDFDIEAMDMCLGDTAQFNFMDSSGCYASNTYSNLDTFYWDFGDGAVATDTNPSHYYTQPGYYDVSLIATDINGCTDSATKTIYIHGDPNPVIYAENVCLGDSMVLADSTSLPFGAILAWDWDFGDGNQQSQVHHPMHYYNTADTYTVRLVVWDNAGCSDTAWANVEVYPNPTAVISGENHCTGEAAWYADSSVAAQVPLAGRVWDMFNDGALTYTTFTVTHTYASPGIYPMELMVYDQYGCRDSVVKTVHIHPLPSADFSMEPHCFRTDGQAYDSSTVASGNIVSWQWNFDQGSTSSLANPTHRFNTAGQQSIALKVMTDSGCVDSVSRNVQVYALPEASFSTSPTCAGAPVPFLQTSTSQFGSIVHYDWTFGDGQSDDIAGPLHAYAQPGLYGISLRVETEYGCADTFWNAHRVYPVPHAGFTWPNNVCEGAPVLLDDVSTIAQVTPGGDSIQYWLWSVGSQYASSSPNPLLSNLATGTHELQLTVVSNYQCRDSAEAILNVYPNPTAAILDSIGCEGEVSKFRDDSEISFGIVDEWHWTIDGTAAYFTESVSHAFDLPGRHRVVLAVKSHQGCPDTTVREIIVPDAPVAGFSAFPTQGCEPFMTELKNASYLLSGSLTYRWYVDDVLVSTAESPVVAWDNDTIAPESHRVTLVAVSDAGCVSTAHEEEAFWVLPAPEASFTVAGEGHSMWEPDIEVENTSRHAISWLWHFGDGRVSRDFAPIHVYKHAGSYLITQKVWNLYGCADSVDQALEIEPVTTMYIPNAFTPNGDGKNDTWFVRGFNEDRAFHIRIYDRWGEEIFESQDMNFEWGGVSKDGRPAQIGVYTYHIRFFASDGELRALRGQFSLVR